MLVERARPDDATAVRALVEQAAEHLTARGIVQWKPGALPELVIRDAIARGELWVVRGDCDRDAGLAAALTLQDADAEIWGADDGSALYLHRLVVARAHAGTGLGRRLLDWACDRGRELERRSLRLDCVASNGFLRSYYGAAGFEERSEVQLGAVRLARFELRFGSDS